MTDSTHDDHGAGGANGLQPGDTLPSQLSAFMDDQLPVAETDLFVRRLVRETELKQTMSRYLLIGEALRQQQVRSPGISRDFSAKVAAALETDTGLASAVATTHARRFGGVWKNVGGVALAASVALGALVLVRQADKMSTEPVMASSSASSNSYIVPVSASTPAAPIPAARLTNYVVAHSEFSSPLGRQNLMTGLLAEDRQAEIDVGSVTAAADETSGSVASVNR
jgi:sigma-E factor negative regulatory protein RseA